MDSHPDAPPAREPQHQRCELAYMGSLQHRIFVFDVTKRKTRILHFVRNDERDPFSFLIFQTIFMCDFAFTREDYSKCRVQYSGDEPE